MFTEDYLSDLLGQFKDLNDSLSNSDNDIEDKLLNIFDNIYSESYIKLTEGFIFEKDFIQNMMEHFINKNDTVKIKNIVKILNKYYKGTVEPIMEKYIKEENYELCSVIRDGLNN